ncbi:hypothetical protein HDU82_006741 [Entophlyctis luteolus]|nr:hypothetical protein HDU82_006741 [Entophlyctis luteolus]
MDADSDAETLALPTPPALWPLPAVSRVRSQPSPTPSSSNASVIASEDDDEGFADVLFPDQLADLRFAHLGKKSHSSSAAVPENSDVEPEAGDLRKLNERILQFAETEGTDQDASADAFSAGLSMPDDFSWNSKLLHPAMTNKPFESVPVQGVNENFPRQLMRKSLGSKPVVFDGTELDFLEDISESESVQQVEALPEPHPVVPLLDIWVESPVLPSSPVVQSPRFAPTNLVGPKMKLHATPKPFAPPTRPTLTGLLGSSFRRSDPNLPRWTSNNVSVLPLPTRKQKKKPTLIRNVNPTDVAHVIGSMVYDPIQQKWTGNEEVLLDFDKETPISPQRKQTAAGTFQGMSPSRNTGVRPALISNKSALAHAVPHIVGNMRFDAVKMCWVGNEEEQDVFAGLEDDGFLGAEDEYGANREKYFALTKAMKQALYVAEASHKLFIGKWYPKAVQEAKTLTRDTSKSHLYDVRTVTDGARERNRELEGVRTAEVRMFDGNLGQTKFETPPSTPRNPGPTRPTATMMRKLSKSGGRSRDRSLSPATSGVGPDNTSDFNQSGPSGDEASSRVPRGATSSGLKIKNILKPLPLGKNSRSKRGGGKDMVISGPIVDENTVLPKGAIPLGKLSSNGKNNNMSSNGKSANISSNGKSVASSNGNVSVNGDAVESRRPRHREQTTEGDFEDRPSARPARSVSTNKLRKQDDSRERMQPQQSRSQSRTRETENGRTRGRSRDSRTNFDSDDDPPPQRPPPRENRRQSPRRTSEDSIGETLQAKPAKKAPLQKNGFLPQSPPIQRKVYADSTDSDDSDPPKSPQKSFTKRKSTQRPPPAPSETDSDNYTDESDHKPTKQVVPSSGQKSKWQQAQKSAPYKFPDAPPKSKQQLRISTQNSSVDSDDSQNAPPVTRSKNAQPKSPQFQSVNTSSYGSPVSPTSPASSAIAAASSRMRYAASATPPVKSAKSSATAGKEVTSPMSPSRKFQRPAILDESSSEGEIPASTAYRKIPEKSPVAKGPSKVQSRNSSDDSDSDEGVRQATEKKNNFSALDSSKTGWARKKRESAALKSAVSSTYDQPSSNALSKLEGKSGNARRGSDSKRNSSDLDVWNDMDAKIAEKKAAVEKQKQKLKQQEEQARRRDAELQLKRQREEEELELKRQQEEQQREAQAQERRRAAAEEAKNAAIAAASALQKSRESVGTSVESYYEENGLRPKSPTSSTGRRTRPPRGPESLAAAAFATVNNSSPLKDTARAKGKPRHSSLSMSSYSLPNTPSHAPATMVEASPATVAATPAVPTVAPSPTVMITKESPTISPSTIVPVIKKFNWANAAAKKVESRDEGLNSASTTAPSPIVVAPVASPLPVVSSAAVAEPPVRAATNGQAAKEKGVVSQKSETGPLDMSDDEGKRSIRPVSPNPSIASSGKRRQRPPRTKSLQSNGKAEKALPPPPQLSAKERSLQNSASAKKIVAAAPEIAREKNAAMWKSIEQELDLELDDQDEDEFANLERQASLFQATNDLKRKSRMVFSKVASLKKPLQQQKSMVDDDMWMMLEMETMELNNVLANRNQIGPVSDQERLRRMEERAMRKLGKLEQKCVVLEKMVKDIDEKIKKQEGDGADEKSKDAKPTLTERLFGGKRKDSAAEGTTPSPSAPPAAKATEQAKSAPVKSVNAAPQKEAESQQNIAIEDTTDATVSKSRFLGRLWNANDSNGTSAATPPKSPAPTQAASTTGTQPTSGSEKTVPILKNSSSATSLKSVLKKDVVVNNVVIPVQQSSVKSEVPQSMNSASQQTKPPSGAQTTAGTAPTTAAVGPNGEKKTVLGWLFGKKDEKDKGKKEEFPKATGVNDGGNGEKQASAGTPMSKQLSSDGESVSSKTSNAAERSAERRKKWAEMKAANGAVGNSSGTESPMPLMSLEERRQLWMARKASDAGITNGPGDERSRMMSPAADGRVAKRAGSRTREQA